MTPMTQQEKLALYTRALGTMTEVLDALRGEPDPDGSVADLVRRIEAEREWVRASLALDEEPRRPVGWVRGLPGSTR
jgi:hypothetical protein